MPVTLAQAKLNAQDDVDANVIDEFRKSSAILDALIFHDAVNPMGGGSTLTYGYHRVVTQRLAAFRAINAEYTPAEATKARFSVDLKPLGGSFQIDRVLADIARGAEVSFQLQQLIKATTTKFGDEVINGDVAVDANGFDGLSKALAGSSTEVGAGAVIDWTDLDTSGFHKALDVLDTFLGVLDGPPTMLIGNRLLIAKIWAISRRANSNVSSPVADLLGATSGQPVIRRFYGEGGPMLIDPGPKAGSNVDIVPVYDDGVDLGLTDLYAVRVGMDGFHGVTPAGQPILRTWLPDFERAGAVKTGETEMGPVGVALKATRSAAVLRRIKVR